ncbi:hypothetical protein CGLO_09732 [Colletotrichum gloeosporioides Cg-14]|uniref:ubiquitinyl hydrolase 1 n=1 Tax=Colletotrichum gloeosporioides (strain Cg-14) TaxID=1237896 RepID=T0LGS6_COLGC|nr:hypothetical protein CGLO_09732 [Colletotrichum gloeosporioides Cg-14]
MSGIAYDAGILKESAQFVIQHWLTLHNSVIPTVCKFKLMIWLATLSYAEDADMNVIQTLASFRTTPSLTTLATPMAASGSFFPSAGADISCSELECALWPEVKPYHRCPDIVRRQDSEELFEYHQRTAVTTLAACLQKQWPCKSPTIPSDHGYFYDWKTYIELWGLPPKLERIFEKPNDNFRFQTYLQEIAIRLPSVVVPPHLAPPMLITPKWNLLRERSFVNANELFRNSPPMVPATDFPDFNCTISGTHSTQQYRLPKLIQRLGDKAQGGYEQKYVNDLQASLRAMQQGDAITGPVTVAGIPSKEELVVHLQACRHDVQQRHGAMLEAIFVPGANQSSFPSKMHNFFQMPRVTPLSILQRLNKDNFGSSLPAWDQYIAGYGIALTSLQRAERMLSCCHDKVALANELRNPGHTNWDPLAYSDSLLLEIESGIIVRGVQQNIADKMRNPPLGENAVLQLNMGEGKSSVIVPMVASSSADGSRIVLVVVAKPQSKQMQQMLIAKLGGLSNRRVFYMPFSRDIRVGMAEASTIASLLQECKQSGGVLLVQPAHILSLQLMCIESEISGNNDVSRMLLQIKDFLDKHARKIVDESDENFNPKFELVYTMGIQQSIEHSPDRWFLIHSVLGMIRKLLPVIRKNNPMVMEISAWPQGGFPRLRILNESARIRLFQIVARRLSQEGAKGLPMAKYPAVTREAVFNYITKPMLTEVETGAIEQSELKDGVSTMVQM